jgi:hypothetical protein
MAGAEKPVQGDGDGAWHSAPAASNGIRNGHPGNRIPGAY